MNIGFIGTGHMAGSLLRAIARQGCHRFYVNDHNKEKIDALKAEIKEVEETDYEGLLSESEFVFLGVKPTDLKPLLEEISTYTSNAIFVSMAAGFATREILDVLGDVPLIRIMPNTPVLVGKGITFATYHKVDEISRKAFEGIMKATGSLYEIEEAKMDAVSVLTGSTPAYLDYFVDALAQFGESVGFSKEEATEYVLKMAEGTIALDMASDKSPIELGREVCSPGGSTIEGVRVLENEGFQDIVKKAAEASYKKTKKMK